MIDRKRRRHAGDLDLDLDVQFDGLVPVELRHLSNVHWTPARVAVRAATLLRATPRTCVLDVGAGIGKVCTIGALSGEGTWVGVEHHPVLAESACTIARRLGVSMRTSFVAGDAFTIDWNDFDALYFYNPFELQLFDDIVVEQAKLALQVSTVQQRLASLPNFTRVVTLRGFGGVMPSSFELLYHELLPSGLDLAMWIQRTPRSVGGFS